MNAGAVVWITGRPSSGKSTFATQLQVELNASGLPSLVLDGDELREILGAHDYSTDGRAGFYATLGELAALVARQGMIALVAATAHRREHREQARKISPQFVEVYVSTPVEECARRDSKALYVRARSDPGIELPGIGVAYETPTSPDVVAEGGYDDQAIDAVLRLLSLQRCSIS